jgi:hypothetical protein
MQTMRRANKTSAKAHCHVHAKSYYGEMDASVVIDWLNSTAKKSLGDGDPVASLVEMNQQLPLEVTDHEVRTYLASIVRKSKLAVAPVLGVVAPDRWEVDWRLVGKMPPMLGLAIVKLLHLADKGLIGRVRKCAKEPCGKWFYAKFEHQRFHSMRCQQETFKTSPEWKRQRREYMKRLRQEKKLRERRQLELAKSKRRGKAR